MGYVRQPQRELLQPRQLVLAPSRPLTTATPAPDKPSNAAQYLLHLQKSYGNRYVQRVAALAKRLDHQTAEDSRPMSTQPLTYHGQPSHFTFNGGCDHLNLHGKTDVAFDSKGNVKNKVETPGKDCDCKKGVPCVHVTGTLVTDYTAKVTITMPPLPSGLTRCEQTQVRAFLKDVLKPHEEDHRAALKTFEGQTQNPIDVTGCGRADIKAQIQAIGDAERTPREAAARAQSDALDPFIRIIDCSACDNKTP
jgi:hypothetical protein